MTYRFHPLSRLALLILVAGYLNSANAYDPAAHNQIADQAVLNSSLVDPTKGPLMDLGLQGIADVFPNPEFGVTLGGFGAKQNATIRQLIDSGAVIEDVTFNLISFRLFPRPVNHFFDPLHNRALTVALPQGLTNDLRNEGIYPFWSSPDWALEDKGQNSNQDYSLTDATGYFFNALTLSKKSDRDTNFGLVFDSLGHVIHHIGDMAQPQHVRNDMHCDSDLCRLIGLYNPSLYETYTEQAAVGKDQSLPLSGYVLTESDFKTARSFWVNGGKGLAEFTNANFVSQGTNYDSPDNVYPGPGQTGTTSVPYSAAYQLQHIPVPDQIQKECSATPGSCNILEVETNVQDLENGANSGTNYAASSYSIFDQDLKKNNQCFSVTNPSGNPISICDVYSVNAINFQSDWGFLLPTAVAYSSGLIDYFFRGRLDVQPDPATPGNYIVTNLSTYALSNGAVTFYYDDADGNRHPLSSPPTTIQTLASQGQISVPVASPLDTGFPGCYTTVFKGTIGTESGIAGKVTTPPNLYVADDGNENGFNGQIEQFGCSEDVLDIETDYSNSNITGQQLVNVAAYGGAVYAEGLWSVRKMIGNTSQPFINYPPPSAQGSRLLSNIAANGNGIYVGYVNTADTNEQVHVDEYSFAGGQVGQQSFTELSAIQGLSVNSQRMCIAGYDDNGVGLAELKDLAGNTVATLASDPGNGGGPCASANDRHYLVVLNSSGDISVKVYDDQGKLWNTLDVSGVFYASGIAATDSNIYISYSYGSNEGIAVFNRIVTKDANGNMVETFTPAGTFDANSGALFGDAVDMQIVLAQPTTP